MRERMKAVTRCLPGPSGALRPGCLHVARSGRFTPRCGQVVMLSNLPPSFPLARQEQTGEGQRCKRTLPKGEGV